MAIHLQESSNLQKGHLKTIDESGIRMIFDTLQKYQYSFPIKSTVRELLSNAVDSVSEKKAAIDILTGKAKVEDYFVELEGDLYKDSKFEPDYYDLNWLHPDNAVTMTYYVGSAFAKDKVVFRDHGVGLGGKRLEGYFKLAFSTKRLSKLPLGKFGLGAKSPLSVGIDFYTMESRYNGKLFRFNIYSSKVDSIIPEVNMITGEPNPFILFNAGTEDEYKVNYLLTEEKNSVTVTLEAKKHHKQQYIDAVKSQMLYFGGMQIRVDTGGVIEDVPYKANILYEDDLIVLSDNNYYSKPHLLLNKVNYGYIAWEELELEEKSGNIGIKVAPEDVEVNPSRESVLWTEKTKNKVLARFNEVVDIAASMIQKELQSTDFMAWLKTCYSVYNKYSEWGGIIGRLSKIVDLNKARFKFGPDPRIIFDSADPLPGIFMREVTVMEEKDAKGVKKKKVLRPDFASFGPRLQRPIYLMKQGERASNRRDKWLFKQHGNTPFLMVQEPYLTLEQAEKDGLSQEELKKLYKGKTTDRQAYWEALTKSAGVQWYEDIEVPEDFTGNDDEIEEVEAAEESVEEVAQAKVAKITAAERRKSKGLTLIATPVCTSRTVLDKNAAGQDVTKYRAFDYRKFEFPIAAINDWDAPEVFYGHEMDNDLLTFVAAITRDPAPENKLGKSVRRHANTPEKWVKMKWFRLNKAKLAAVNLTPWDGYHLQHFYDCQVMIVKVAQTNAKLFRDFRHIREFFIQIQNKTITMSNQLIKWNTARLIMERLGACAFLHNFPFHEDYSEMYAELCQYVNKHYRDVKTYTEGGKHYGMSDATYNDMVGHLDKVHKFQQYVAQAPNDFEGIGMMAGQLFGNKDLRDGMAVDPQMMAQLDEVLAFTQACGIMLNHIPVLTGYTLLPATYSPTLSRSTKGATVPEDLELEIRMYLQNRGVLDFKSSRQEIAEQIAGDQHEMERAQALDEMANGKEALYS